MLIVFQHSPRQLQAVDPILGMHSRFKTPDLDSIEMGVGHRDGIHPL